MPEAWLVMTATDSEDEARRLARGLIEGRLAACVQRLPIASTYEWQGELREEAEILLLIKTTGDRFRAVEDWIRRNHSYEVPEVLAVPAEAWSADYLDWMKAMTRGGEASGMEAL